MSANPETIALGLVAVGSGLAAAKGHIPPEAWEAFLRLCGISPEAARLLIYVARSKASLADVAAAVRDIEAAEAGP